MCVPGNEDRPLYCLYCLQAVSGGRLTATAQSVGLARGPEVYVGTARQGVPTA